MGPKIFEWKRKKDPTTGKEADLKRMVTVAKELEYEMTEDDYIKANEKYLNEIGGFNTLKALVRLHTLRTKVENNIVNNE